MRVDKFLKVSRLLKRRTVAQAACGGGRVLLGDKPIKPGHKLKVGDIVTILFGDSRLTFEVLLLNEKANKADSGEMFRIIEDAQ